MIWHVMSRDPGNMQDILHEMEHRYHCRYERGEHLQTFPVTHVLKTGRTEANNGRTMPARSAEKWSLQGWPR